MPWIPEKYAPEEPKDFALMRRRAEGGFGAHPNHVLWMLDRLEQLEGKPAENESLTTKNPGQMELMP